MSTTLSPAAAEQGRLWGGRVRDWAEIQERGVYPAFEAVFAHLDVTPGSTFLDVACGAGPGSRLAAERGARVSGIDASPELLAIARERVPDGDFRVGEILSLPWPADTFDNVVGFNAFQYAVDIVAALREARRVTKPGGQVGIVVWGSVDECEAVAHFKALAALMPPPPPGAPAPLAGEQRIAEMAEEAGLKVESDERVDCPWSYPDLKTALRGLMSAGPVARVIEHAGEQDVEQALTDCLADFQTEIGGYVFHNKFRALTTRA